MSTDVFKDPRWNRKHPTKNYRRLIGWTSDNKTNLPADYIPALEEKFAGNPNMARAHLRGEFCPLVGKGAAPEFKGNHIVEWPADPHLPFTLSFDFNVDPLAWCIFQRPWIEVGYQRIQIAVIVLDSNGSDSLVMDATADAAQKLLRVGNVQNQLIEIDGDSQGHRRNVTGPGTPFIQAKNHLRANNFGNVRIVAAEYNPREEDSIDCLNNAFANGWLYVHRECVNVIRSLESAQLVPGKKKLLKKQNDQETHWYDAVKYPVFRWTEHEAMKDVKLPKVLF